MSRIAAEHVAREAIVYVRQSTVDQVINNGESRRRQYGLVERARQRDGPKSASSMTTSVVRDRAPCACRSIIALRLPLSSSSVSSSIAASISSQFSAASHGEPDNRPLAN